MGWASQTASPPFDRLDLGTCPSRVGPRSPADRDHARPIGRSRMTEHETRRIWYQSFVDPAEQASYIDRLGARLRRLLSPGIAVDVHGISPPDRFFHPLTEFRCAEQTIRAA